MTSHAKNVIVKRLLVTDLSQQMRSQRNFLRWMARRHKDTNPEQAAAFETGARLFDELRAEILAGDYDASSRRKEVFTRAAAGAAVPPAKKPGRLELTPEEIAELDAVAEAEEKFYD